MIQSLFKVPIQGQVTETNWLTVLPLIKEHKLAGYFSKETLQTLPRDLQRVLLTESTQQKQYNTLLMSEIGSWKNKDFIVLKGCALLNQLYLDWSIRPISDIDILVSKDQVDGIKNQLKSSGFNESSENKWKANSHKSVWSKEVFETEITVEVHTQLFYNEPKNFVWNIQKNDSGFSVLQKEDFLLHLVGHLAHQHTFIKLFWLYDIKLFIEKYQEQIDWSLIQKKAKELKLVRSLDATLWILQNLLSMRMIPVKAKSDWSNLLTWSFLIYNRTQALRYQIVKHLLKDSYYEAFLYDILWLKNWLLKVPGKFARFAQPPSSN